MGPPPSNEPPKYVIMRAVGDSMILSPPLIISESEIDELMACVKSIKKEVS